MMELLCRILCCCCSEFDEDCRAAARRTSHPHTTSRSTLLPPSCYGYADLQPRRSPQPNPAQTAITASANSNKPQAPDPSLSASARPRPGDGSTRSTAPPSGTEASSRASALASIAGQSQHNHRSISAHATVPAGNIPQPPVAAPAIILPSSSEGPRRDVAVPQRSVQTKPRPGEDSKRRPPTPELPCSVPSISLPKSAERRAPAKPEEGEAASSVGRRTAVPVYRIPEHLKEQIEKDEVPRILHTSLCPSNYADYFACLLYAEDFYLEKWSDYLLKDVTLKHKEFDMTSRNNKATQISKKKGYYVSFDIDAIPERRPFLLSRDFVNLQPCGISKNGKVFQGSLVRVIHSKTILAEFGDDFYSQHKTQNKYDVSFSFNRTCLKRAHHAVANALGPVLFNFLFPVGTDRSNHPLPAPAYCSDMKMLAVYKILMLKHPLPFLIQGPLSTYFNKKSYSLEESDPSKLSDVGHVVVESIRRLLRRNSDSRILICAPRNTTCDILMSCLLDATPERSIFRANAAFRNRDDVPLDIISSSSYDDSMYLFTCPSLSALKDFKVISSTYMSSFRLSSAGVGAGHFTHIFLVDASSVAEPEAVVPLSNLACQETVVVVSGCMSDSPNYVRSGIARKWGLKLSYFHRLLKSEPYSDGDPSFVCNIQEDD